jgi:hypothetical protein
MVKLALQKYRAATMGAALAPPAVTQELLDAISIAAMQGVIRVPRAEDVLRSESGQLEEPFVREILRLIVASPGVSTATTTNIQGDVGQVTINYNNAIKEINSKNIPEETKTRLRRIADFLRNHYPPILLFVSEGLRRIPGAS